MHGACHTAGFRCIHDQSWGKRPHQLLRSPWGRSAICREWSIDIVKSQWVWKEGNAKINQVSAMTPGLAKIIEKVCISWYFESRETDLHLVENAYCIDYSVTWSSKWFYWLSKSQSPSCGTSDYACEDSWELYTRISQAGLPITGIHTLVASKPKIHWIPATAHNSRWMEDCEVCGGRIDAITILDPVDIEEAHSYIASCYYSAQRHVESHGWPDGSFR